MKYFDQKNNRLVFVNQKATPAFWDGLWKISDLEKEIKKGMEDKFVSKLTKKFIEAKKSKKILEGGCGKGQFVYSLNLSGYEAYGIDYASETIKKINQIIPELKISLGDVEDINFSDNFFDGYWSLGVIEHFFDGYDKTIKEAKRVIKPGGFLFLTFPYMSPLRKWKARLNKYPAFIEKSLNKEDFYQFALDARQIERDLKKIGFILKYKRPFDGIKGLKDEVRFLNPILQKIYNSKNLLSIYVCGIISLFMKNIAGHSMLLVFKKEK